MKFQLNNIFNKPKPVIGMLHLGYLFGQEKFPGTEAVVHQAIEDIKALESGGVDGILIENWKEESNSEFVTSETLSCMSTIVKKLKKVVKVPFGINVLNNDYKAAYSIAKLHGASFVQLDVFVDEVESSFSFNKNAIKSPFKIYPNPKHVFNYANDINASQIPLFVFIQPKHYTLLEKNKPITKSAVQAIDAGASALIITKETTIAPSIEKIQEVKNVSGSIPVGVGSGINSENIAEYLPHTDFVIVGSSLKYDGITDNPVDFNRVKKLMKIVSNFKFYHPVM